MKIDDIDFDELKRHLTKKAPFKDELELYLCIDIYVTVYIMDTYGIMSCEYTDRIIDILIELGFIKRELEYKNTEIGTQIKTHLVLA